MDIHHFVAALLQLGAALKHVLLGRCFEFFEIVILVFIAGMGQLLQFIKNAHSKASLWE